MASGEVRTDEGGGGDRTEQNRSDGERIIAKKGWLEKQGEKGLWKGWKRRYFRLCSDTKRLRYATSPIAPLSAGLIDLQMVGIL
jgi:hypothetical protein